MTLAIFPTGLYVYVKKENYYSKCFMIKKYFDNEITWK